MDLYLLRHGKAEDRNPEGDTARELLEKGREQARKAGRLVRSLGKPPEIVLTSPYTRALQTAEEFCAAAGLPGPVIQGWLGIGMDPESAVKELSGYTEFRRVCLVGHEPSFSELVAFLIGAQARSIDFKKGALAGLQINPPSRHGTLCFLLPPKWVDDE
jgi:phosphohistidine phosphatase